MTTEQARKAGLKNNAFHLATAIGGEGHCEPASRVVRDGHHKGTMFSWLGDEWIVVDLENRQYLGNYDRLAVVTLEDPQNEADYDDADNGLNQAALGIDLECPGGEWVVDAGDLAELQESYEGRLAILWEQK